MQREGQAMTEPADAGADGGGQQHADDEDRPAPPPAAGERRHGCRRGPAGWRLRPHLGRLQQRRHRPGLSAQPLAQTDDVLQQFPAGLVTLGGILGHHLVDEDGQVRRQVGADFRQRLRLGANVLQGHLERRIALEGRMAGQHVITGDAQRVDVGTAIHRLAFDLLGAHVQRRTHRHAALRQVEGRTIAGQAADQTEVGDLDLALARQQDVLRLDVAVDDAQLAGPLQRRRHLAENAQRQQHVGRTLLEQEFAQVAALDVFQGHVRHTVGLADGVDLDDVGVGGLGDGGGLGLEALQGGGVGRQLRPKDLQGDLALQRDLFGEVNLAHAALAEMAQDVEVGQGSAGQVEFAAGQSAGRRRTGLRHRVRHAWGLGFRGERGRQPAGAGQPAG